MIKGVSDDQFRRVVNAADMAFKTGNGSLPSIADVARLAGTRANTVTKVVNSQEGKNALLQRGIRWTTNINLVGVLTPEQILAISIITDPTNRKSFAEKLKQAGISYAQYKAWLKNDVFATKVSEIGESLLQDNVATVHARLVDRAAAGDVQSMRLFYEVSGRHDPSQKQMVDVVRIVQLVLETITRHVRDTQALAAITSDIDVILSGGTPKPLGSMPANYVSGEVIDDGPDSLGSDSSGSSSTDSIPSPPSVETPDYTEVRHRITSGAVVEPFQLPEDFFEFKGENEHPTD